MNKISYPLAIVVSLGISGFVTFYAKKWLITAFDGAYADSTLAPVAIFLAVFLVLIVISEKITKR